jgi:hypothetical protein
MKAVDPRPSAEHTYGAFVNTQGLLFVFARAGKSLFLDRVLGGQSKRRPFAGD